LCRIAGILNADGDLQRMKAAVQEMCDLQKHGGPDDEGLWAGENGIVMGHRRLSLIDLSSAGHQPMIRKSAFAISFNGEIYNYQLLKDELKALGHEFNTHSDTEVILAAFEQWGPHSFARLEGMFAFALWDSRNKKCWLVRDASGIKPLYFLQDEEGIIFASELRAFTLFGKRVKENKNWKIHLLAYGHIPEPITMYENVRPVPKGFCVSYGAENRELQFRSFKFYSYCEKEHNKEAAEANIRQLLEKAVKSHLISDAPIGVFLSGGIDSGILFLLAAAQKQQQLNSLSIYFNEKQYSEKKYQDLLLEKVNCDKNQYLLTQKLFLDSLPRICNDMDQPSCDGINTWFISRYAKAQGLKAVLSGIGADELLGGYPSFQRMRYANLAKDLPGIHLPAKVMRTKFSRRLSYLSIPGITGMYLFLRGQFTAPEIARQLDATEADVWDCLESLPILPAVDKLAPGNQASWMEVNMYMQNQLLRDADVMSMAHGIEIRVPFLDHDFQHYCNRINSGLKYNTRVPKELLINAFKNELPAAVWQRPKMGFSFPFQDWFLESDYIKDTMSVAPAPIRANYQRFMEGKLHWSQLLSLFLVQTKARA
jgi:asparagine synthase (glutamine-hydrolysing)